MPMPDGAAPPFAWTLQPAGATFDPPITIEYPNMSGLAPGAVAYFLSFDHDTGRFEIVASGHVTEDGSTIVTDPGVGLTLAGWGCNCPPYSVTGDCENDPCEEAQDFMNAQCADSRGSGAGALNCQLACLANGGCSPENPDWVRCTIQDFTDNRRRGNTGPVEDFCRRIPSWIPAVIIGPFTFNAGDLCFAFDGTAHLFGELVPSWQRKCDEIADGEHNAFLFGTLVPCLLGNSDLSFPFRGLGAIAVPVFANIAREIIQATCAGGGSGGGGGFPQLPPLPTKEQLFSMELEEASALQVNAGEQFFLQVGEQVQLRVTRRNPDDSVDDLTSAASGTLYFAVAPYVRGFGPQTVTVSADGLLTVLATSSPFAPLPVQLLVAVRNGEALGIGQFAIFDTDSDGDLLVDSYEMRMGLDPAVPGALDADSDNDGIRDVDEALVGTHPLLADTDGDGLSDGFELDQGSDPLDPASFLPSFAPPARRSGAGAGECPAADELPVVSINGQRVTANPDGSFKVANFAAPDLFGAGGPGTAPDFLSDDPLRVTAVFSRGCRTYYAWSEPFRIRQGETATVGDLTISEHPPPLPERIAITLPATTLGAGESVQLTVTGALGEFWDFFGGAEVDVTTRERGTTYRTSSPAIATVDELGVLTAHAPGRAFITATNEGASAVRRVDVVSDVVRVTVSGRLLLPGGAPAAAALVTGPRGQSTVAGGDGRFSLVLSLGRKETAQLRMQLVIEGERFGAAVPLGTPKDGAALELGDVTLEPGQDLLIEGFDPLGDNEQGYPEYCHLATGLIFVLLPGGSFLMGSPEDEPGYWFAEGRVHEVELSPFVIAKYEVTQEVWERVMGSNRSSFRDFPESPSHPVEEVSWNDAQAFCQATGLKLPTEAQWEYAARAGTRTAFYNGPITQLSCTPLDPLLDAIGWYCGNSGNRTHPVGEKAPNAFGLHEMHGNVWEWCKDVYDSSFYEKPEARKKDPDATTGSWLRVVRGGGWIYDARLCRSAERIRGAPSDRSTDLGFRPALFPLP
jgi:formylglycine-generating enzyme required for sulfatase activity